MNAGASSRLFERRWVAVSLVVLLIGTLVQYRFLWKGLGADMYDFRQFQTAMVAREFMRTGFDWRTPLPVFGAHSYVPFEFPAVQWLAAGLGQVLGTTADVATRLTGLIAFQLTAAAMWVVAQQWFSRATAIVALVLFEFLPFGIQWGHAALIDFWPAALMLVATALLTWAAVADPTRRRTAALVAVVALVPAAFLIKSTSGVALAPLLLVPGLMVWTTTSRRDRWRPFVVAGTSLAVAALATVLWTRITDDVKASSHWTEPLTSSRLATWTFGTMEQRLSFDTWDTIVNVHWSVITGGLALLVVITGIAVIGWRASPAAVILALTPLLGPLLFVNLYDQHAYYSIAVYPVLAILMGAACATLASRLTRARDRAVGSTAFVLLVLLVAWLGPEGGYYVAMLIRADYSPTIAADLRRVVPEGKGVLLLDCDWHPMVAYDADRFALMIAAWENSRPTAADLTGITHAAFCKEPAEGYAAALRDVLPPGFTSTLVAPRLFALNPPT